MLFTSSCAGQTDTHGFALEFASYLPRLTIRDSSSQLCHLTVCTTDLRIALAPVRLCQPESLTRIWDSGIDDAASTNASKGDSLYSPVKLRYQQLSMA